MGALPTRLKSHPKLPHPPHSALSPPGLFWERGPGSPPLCSSRVLYRLELANLERVVRISAKPTKRLQEALQPILAKHGLNLDQVVLHRVSSGAVGAGRGEGEARQQERTCGLAPRLLTSFCSQGRSSSWIWRS